MKTKNKIIIAISVILVLSIIAVGLFIYNKNKQKNNEPEDLVVLKDNVIVITSETDDNLQPYKIDENNLYFKKNPEYNKNDVVVSGMTKAAPNGYIRRIIKTEELNGEFVVETEPATFLDVFEELHIDRTFTLIKGEQSPTIETQSKKTDAINISSLTKTEKENNFSIKESSDKDSDELFKVEFEGDLCEEIHIEGETTVKLWLNTKIDIDDCHITWEMTANDEVNGNILLGYSASVEDEYTKELFDAQLPNIQFMAGPVPIVITNEVSADLNVEGEIEGKIGTEIEINKSDKAGFIYTSKTNKVEDITSQKFTDGGIEWNSGASVEVATSAGVEIGLTSLFYDCSGADISVGVAGDIEGKAVLSTVGTTEEPLEGKIALSIYPYLQGGIVVKVPVIDNQLVELSLFELELKPFWEKVWDTQKPIPVDNPIFNKEIKKGSKISFLVFEYSWKASYSAEKYGYNDWWDKKIDTNHSFYEIEIETELAKKQNLNWLMQNNKIHFSHRFNDGQADVQGLNATYYEISNYNPQETINCALEIAPFSRWAGSYIKIFVNEELVTIIDFPEKAKMDEHYLWKIAIIENAELKILNDVELKNHDNDIAETETTIINTTNNSNKQDELWKQTYNEILKTLQQTNSSEYLTASIYPAPDSKIIENIGGIGSIGPLTKNDELLYYIEDLDKKQYPELILGKKNSSGTKIIAIYQFFENQTGFVSDYASNIATINEYEPQNEIFICTNSEIITIDGESDNKILHTDVIPPENMPWKKIDTRIT